MEDYCSQRWQHSRREGRFLPELIKWPEKNPTHRLAQDSVQLDHLEITHYNPSGAENILHKLGALLEIKITQGKAFLCFHVSMPTGSAVLNSRL